MIDSHVVDRLQLRLGPLLAEGGEGRVYELVDSPDRVYKAFRSPQPGTGLAELVSWSTTLEPAAARRVEASTAWPVALAVDGPLVHGAGKADPGPVAGLVLPRAPRRFSIRHRDGHAHLATLSYLTADPDRRSAAYGIDLPPAMSPERLGLVYALARLIEAFEAASPAVSHGDLSAKNVLWSLSRGPEVFIIDCDNGERYASGVPLGSADRRRAMTPNWDDPSVRSGSNPGPYADRYSLALIFLRVCGAAHYPIQKRQKAGERIEVEIGVPATARRIRSLSAAGPLWHLCSAGLGNDPASRPPAATWVAALEAVIGELGAARILDAVWASQGRAPLRSGSPAALGGAGTIATGAAPTGDAALSSVRVHPVPYRPRLESRPSRVVVPAAAPVSGTAATSGAGWTLVRTRTGGVTTTRPGVPPTGWAVGPGGQAGVGVRPARPNGPSIGAQLKSLLAAVVSWLIAEHRTTLRYLRTTEQRGRGVLRIPWCVAIDFVAACVVLFVVAMIAAPFLGV